MQYTSWLGYSLLLISIGIVSGLDVDQGQYPVIYTRRSEDELPFDIVQEPIPPECNLQPNTDYDGAAIRWGHRPAPPVRSAAECCRMCLDWLPRLGKTCDAWIQVVHAGPLTFGHMKLVRYWERYNDKQNKKSISLVTLDPTSTKHPCGECWLKHQADWNGDPATLVENARGDYPSEWLKLHNTSPSRVPWTAGYRTA